MGEPEILETNEQEDLFFESGGEKVPEEEEVKAEEAEEKGEPEKKEEEPEVKILDDNRVQVGDKVFITKSALDEARGEQKELKQELDGVKGQLGQFASLRDELEAYRRERQAKEQEQDQAKKEEKFEEDPVGTLKDEVEALKKERENATTEAQSAKVQADIIEHVQSTTATLADKYTQENPDYPEAFNHLITVRTQELETLGYQPAQINKIINQEAFQLSAGAIQRGQNPAEIVHQLAKARGYAPQAKDDTPGNDLEKKLENIEKGQENSSSLAGSGGEAEEVGFLKDIETMSDEDFDKLWAELESKSD